MKKSLFTALTLLMVIVLLVGCSQPPSELSDPTTTAPVTDPTTEPTSTPEDTTTPLDDTAYYIEEVYFQQIGRYFTALWEQWEIFTYYEQGMSALPSYYYEGDPLENVGFSLMDLDKDGHKELLIGAIWGADQDPAIFEIWTLVNGAPVMLAQGNSQNRYMLQYEEAQQQWYIANESSDSAANWATYQLRLNQGKLEVVQGVVFDMFSDPENPWFQTHDLDWNIANDQPIDESTANTIMDTCRKSYAVPEYFPYTYYLQIAPPDTEQQTQETKKQQVLDRAQQLSERFGLDIQIPEQSALDYTHYHATEMTDLTFMNQALDVLEDTLSLYPEGFFHQLSYGSIESIRIELVGSLTVKDGMDIDPSSTNAFTQDWGNYHLVVIHGHFIDSQTLFHEFSHIIDKRLLWDSQNRADAMYSEEAWLALQPEGFRYSTSYTNIPEELHSFLESDYFIMDYALTFPTEDRATLLAAAMANESQQFETGSGRRAKLQFYADCIRDSFDTEGWPETTLWEQVLK